MTAREIVACLVGAMSWPSSLGSSYSLVSSLILYGAAKPQKPKITVKVSVPI